MARSFATHAATALRTDDTETPVLSPTERTTVQQLSTLLTVVIKALGRVTVAAPPPVVAPAPPRSHAHERQTRPTAPPRMRVSHVRYVPTDRRTRTPDVPARDLAVYRAILPLRHGATRAALLHKFHAQTHTGVIDGAIRRLRMKRLIRVDIVG